MTAMEYELLRVFLANLNCVLWRDQLLMHTRNREWSYSIARSTSGSDACAARSSPSRRGELRCIRTVRNAGYMFVPDG